jgi:hypothetical protein
MISQKLLERILREEQARLRLLDWDIRIRLGTVRGDHAGAIASNTIDYQASQATIILPVEHTERIKDADYDLPGETEDDWLRDSIRHELGHLFGYPLRNRLEDVLDENGKKTLLEYEEAFINRWVRALKTPSKKAGSSNGK